MQDVSPEVYRILQKAVKGKMDSFLITSIGSNKKGEGYLGQIFFISLQDKVTGKQLNVVVKQAFSSKAMRDLNPIRSLFLNEIYFYTKVWPALSEFQDRIPVNYHFEHLSKCFATSSEENSELLVLENLKHGFEVHDKKNTLKKEHFEFIFRIYAKFHAASFAYRELHPEEFYGIVDDIEDAWEQFSRTGHFQEAIKSVHRLCLGNLQPGVDDDVIERYKHYVEDGVELFRKSLVNEKDTGIALIHGDCWSNNMMFQYDDTGKLIDIRLLDFQLCRLGPPVCDLSYCLYSGGTKEAFDDLDHLLQVYHESLCECLRAYGCDPNRIYPFEAMKKDWKKYCQMGMTMGLILWRGRLTHDEDIVDLTDVTNNEGDIDKFFDTKYDKDTYKKITRDIILHLYKNDYLY